jgi:hypothetical protein
MPSRSVSVKVRDVYDLQVKWFWRSDYLNGIAVSDVERRPQSLVAPSDLAERSLQRVCVEFSLQQDSAHKVVSRIARLELIEKPESLLRERQRERDHALRDEKFFQHSEC